MLIPQVVGFKLTGKLPEGATATDLVLTVTQMLRKKGVVGKFVEFYGPGLAALSLADRATIANMAPEYGATIGFFPVDDETLDYLRFTGRREEQVALVEAYCKEQGLFRTRRHARARVHRHARARPRAPSSRRLAGPKRPQDRVALTRREGRPSQDALADRWPSDEGRRRRADASRHGVASSCTSGSRRSATASVVIAAITTLHQHLEPVGADRRRPRSPRRPSRRASTTKPWVKTSPRARARRSSPSTCNEAGLTAVPRALGFHLVGYGCTTCIGNSGPLPEHVADGDRRRATSSSPPCSRGNRNFEGRINPHVRANYLASPPLVVAYALAGTHRHRPRPTSRSARARTASRST